MPDEAVIEAREDDAKSVVFDSAPAPGPVVEKLAGPSLDEPLIDRLVERLTKVFGRKSDADEYGAAFKVVGNTWLATYSNNFKDRDGEIFPAKAIDQYVARVDNGLVPKPELWIWHAGKSSRVGQADVVARQGHFVLAAGTWDDTPQGQSARAYYARHQKDTSLSHGFNYSRRTFDGVHYNDFNTFEISLLPRGAEANYFTNLEGVKAMSISDEKVKYLTQALGADAVAKIMTEMEGRGKELEALDVEFKDFGHLDEAAAPAETVSDNKALGDLVADLIGGQSEGLKASTEALKAVKSLTARLDAQDAEIAALKTQLDGRPRSASTDDATTLDDTRLKALADAAAQTDTARDSFWFPKG